MRGSKSKIYGLKSTGVYLLTDLIEHLPEEWLILYLNHYLYLSSGNSFLYGDDFCVSLYNPFIISSKRSSCVCNNFWCLAQSFDDE